MPNNNNKMTIPLNAVPFDEMIASMGTGIAEAQRKLDEISFEITKMMSGTDQKYRIRLADRPNARSYSLLELGFTPTFYQFVDTVLEIKVAFSMSSESSPGGNEKTTYKAKGTTVDAAYSNKFQYPVEGSSVLRTKLVTVPPPGLLDARVREFVEIERAGTSAKPKP